MLLPPLPTETPQRPAGAQIVVGEPTSGDAEAAENPRAVGAEGVGGVRELAPEPVVRPTVGAAMPSVRVIAPVSISARVIWTLRRPGRWSQQVRALRSWTAPMESRRDRTGRIGASPASASSTAATWPLASR